MSRAKTDETDSVRIDACKTMFPDKKRDYELFYVKCGIECLDDIEYEELLELRDLINRIEEERKQQRGDRQ